MRLNTFEYLLVVTTPVVNMQVPMVSNTYKWQVKRGHSSQVAAGRSGRVKKSKGRRYDQLDLLDLSIVE